LQASLVELTVLNSTITDQSLAALIGSLPGVASLRLIACNDISELGFWSCLPARLTSLHVTDCVSVTDLSVAAAVQAAPRLTNFELQAYHVTDACLMPLFDQPAAECLRGLALNSCWEVTSQGVVLLAANLAWLQRLSLSGCSKITDDAIDAIGERMKQLRELDLSWCARITDVSLECIACDLCQLEVLQLDRCSSISDIGVGYLSTMPKLRSLCLRWCSSLSDTSIRHILNLRTLSFLSVAGNSRISGDGFCHLIRMRQLRAVELTNCPSATATIRKFLNAHLPSCRVFC
uniref:F-box/LRR-repeat protein 20 n=1 Tax=Macrostomum lignano TaxID=282301 RepID=A0A1I8I3M6_9PLAT